MNVEIEKKLLEFTLKGYVLERINLAASRVCYYFTNEKIANCSYEDCSLYDVTVSSGHQTDIETIKERAIIKLEKYFEHRKTYF